MACPPPPRKRTTPEPCASQKAHGFILCREADAGFRKDCQSCCLSEIAVSTDFEAHSQEPDFRRINHLSYQSGEVLFHEGDPGESVYSVRSGLIKLVHYQQNGTERIVRLLKKGGMAGLEVFVCQRYHHTAIVVRSVDACRIPTGILSRLSAIKPRFYDMLLQRWQEDLDLADFWICQFSTGSTEARVARLLLFLIEFGELEPGVAVHLLSRQDMAGILGVTCESVCRMISHFRHAGVLLRDSPGLYQCDVHALKQIASV